jgi:hypothetical protein
MDDKRRPPWTLDTIGEVIESMELLKKQGFSDDTPIVWYHLENHNLTGQVIETIIPYEEPDNDPGRENWVEITLEEREDH